MLLMTGDSNTKLTKGTSNTLRIDTNSAYLQIGPQNSSYSHYDTNATSGHYFGQNTTINGNLIFYGTSYGMTLTGAMTGSSLNVGTGSITAGTVTANLTGIATKASTLYNDSAYMTFHWSGQDGQPTWLWGGNAAGDMYVYNPSNFVVASSNAVRGVNCHADTTAPTGTTQLNCDGHFYATKVFNAVYNDLAEFMWKDLSDYAQAGDVLVATDDGVRRSQKRADSAVVGVYSDSFRMALYNQDEDKKYPVGMTGTLLVKLYGDAKVGDQLVSYKDGFAIKANLWEKLFKRDALIGKVISSKKDKNERIMILIK